MYFFFIFVIILKIILLYPYCKEETNNCKLCNPLTNLCTKCSLDIYSPDNDGGCSPISKCMIGKNYCLNCDELSKNCIDCQVGLYPDENGGCSFINNCEVSYKGYCLKCKEDFILIGTLCKSLFLDDYMNCKRINNITGFCQECKDGYFLNSGDNKCSDIDNCKESTFGKCISCNKGYYLNVKNNLCIKSNNEENDLLFCKESLDGKKCDICEEDYFFDEKGKCVGINYCSERNDYLCEKCIEGYYFNRYRDTCVTSQNCALGDRIHGLCRECELNYYLDLNDRKCKSYEENQNIKYCEKVENNICISCNFPYYLSEDGKCSDTKNCSEVINGTCISCNDGYYLGLDNRCINVEHCIYSNIYFECNECEEGYYYNITSKKCHKYNNGYENCKITSYDGDYCASCKINYYNNQTDHLCYNNSESNNFYKCSLTDKTVTFCVQCENDYHIGIKDNKCNNIKYCQLSEGGKCLECEEKYCLDVKSNKCENNNKIISEEKKHFYKCKKTNDEGTSCETCINGYEIKNGLCSNNYLCIEKNENGECLKCQNDVEYISCLNNDFGCVYFQDLNCNECNNVEETFRCSKCKEGYKLNEKYECIQN